MKLVNETGVSTGTQILQDDGTPMKQVVYIKLDPITVPPHTLKALVEFQFLQGFSLEVEPYVHMHTLELLAAQHGMKLIPETVEDTNT